MEPIKIIITDDHQVVAQGLKALFEDEPGFDVLGVATSGADLLAKIPSTRPHVVLLDVNMPGMDGIETVRQLRLAFPALPVLMLSSHNEWGLVSATLENGAQGYILKSAAPEELFEAVRKVARGETTLDSTLTSRLIHSLTKKGSPGTDHPLKVTPREREVISLIARELTIKEIADQMGVSAHTVVAHKKNLFAKFEVKNSVGLVKAALEAGVINH